MGDGNGRCLHRGALLADGHIRGDDLICGVHNWDYRYDTGVSAYNNEETLPKFTAWVDHEADAVCVDEAEIAAWEQQNPQPYQRDAYLGLYADTRGTAVEPHNKYIRNLAEWGWRLAFLCPVASGRVFVVSSPHQFSHCPQPQAPLRRRTFV